MRGKWFSGCVLLIRPCVGPTQVPTVSIVSAIAREAEVVFDHEAVYDNLIAIASQAGLIAGPCDITNIS